MYMGELLAQLNQVWLKSIKMSKLFDKQVNVQKESLKKSLQGSLKLPKACKKLCNENETKKKMTHIKIFLMKGSTSLRCI